MFACCVLQSRVCALDTNLIFATATEVNFIPDIPMSNLGAFFAKKKKKSLYTNGVSLKEFGFSSAIDYHRFRGTCAGRCRAAKRKRVHRQRERARPVAARL